MDAGTRREGVELVSSKSKQRSSTAGDHDDYDDHHHHHEHDIEGQLGPVRRRQVRDEGLERGPREPAEEFEERSGGERWELVEANGRPVGPLPVGAGCVHR